MQKSTVSLTTRGITIMAMLVAMAILLKSFLVFETGAFRVTVYEIPMVVIGGLFGPILGGIMGFVVDFFHVLFSPWAFTFNVFTISNIMWGVIPGLLLYQKEWTIRRLLTVFILAGVVAFSLNTVGIAYYQGTGAMIATLPYRIALLIIKVPLQVLVLDTIYQRVIVSMFKLQN